MMAPTPGLDCLVVPHGVDATGFIRRTEPEVWTLIEPLLPMALESMYAQIKLIPGGYSLHGVDTPELIRRQCAYWRVMCCERDLARYRAQARLVGLVHRERDVSIHIYLAGYGMTLQYLFEAIRQKPDLTDTNRLNFYSALHSIVMNDIIETVSAYFTLWVEL